MQTRQELEEAYKATDYVVEEGNVKIVIRLDRKNRELDQLLAELAINTWAFITAFNPRSERLMEKENVARHSELLAATTAGNYEFLNGYGRGSIGDWPPEKSLFIFNIDREAAIEIGKRFGQNAIVVGQVGGVPELVWCN